MGLLNDAKVEAKAEKKAATTVKADKAEKKAKNKEKKQAKRAALNKILDYCREKNLFADEVELLTVKEGGFGGGDGLFEKLFPNAKVGDKVTAFEMFERTDKNIKQMVKKCAEWAEKGKHFVKYDANTKTFSIEKL